VIVGIGSDLCDIQRVEKTLARFGERFIDRCFMGVVNLPSGQPTMRLTGGAAERLRAILPPGTEPFIHLTITDEKGLAQAFVVIEARAAGGSRYAG